MEPVLKDTWAKFSQSREWQPEKMSHSANIFTPTLTFRSLVSECNSYVQSQLPKTLEYRSRG